MANFEKLSAPSKKSQLKRWEMHEKKPRTDAENQREYDSARKRQRQREKDPRYESWVERHNRGYTTKVR